MINQNLQFELRKKFNPDGSQLRNLQLRMLEILVYIDKVCRENDIKYWLSSGTLLGAVRHGGYIPWDDDADIEMLREDYDKLIDVLSKQDVYDLQTYENDPGYVKPFAKLRDRHSRVLEGMDSCYKYEGCWVDIFPMEKNSWFRQWLFSEIYYHLAPGPKKRHPENLKRLEWGKNVFFNWIVPYNRFITKIFPFRYHYHSLGCFAKEKRDVKDIFPLKDIEFEGHKFLAPRDCDAHLKKLYGDYMKLPDVDKIETHLLKMELW